MANPGLQTNNPVYNTLVSSWGYFQWTCWLLLCNLNFLPQELNSFSVLTRPVFSTSRRIAILFSLFSSRIIGKKQGLFSVTLCIYFYVSLKKYYVATLNVIWKHYFNLWYVILFLIWFRSNIQCYLQTCNIVFECFKNSVLGYKTVIYQQCYV